jgi:urease accessory protein
VLAVEDKRAIVVQFERRDAAVIDLPQSTTVAVELGHRIGNQHWDLAVEDGSIYVPIEADRHIIEDVLAERLPEDAAIEYEEVDPALWLDGEVADHEHGHDGHSHDDAGSHTHGSTGVDYRDVQDGTANSDTTGGDRA